MADNPLLNDLRGFGSVMYNYACVTQGLKDADKTQNPKLRCLLYQEIYKNAERVIETVANFRKLSPITSRLLFETISPLERHCLSLTSESKELENSFQYQMENPDDAELFRRFLNRISPRDK